MSRERIFSGSGTGPAKGVHPIVVFLIVAYIVFVIYVIATYGLKNVRVTAPGPLLIYAAQRSTRNREGEPISIYVDKVEANEICLGYRLDEKEKEFFIDEYSHWYYVSKGMRGKTKEFELVMKIKSVKNETVYVTEEVDLIPNTSWELQDAKPDGDIIIKAHDLAMMIVAIDIHST
jgi:hypothetical protein